MTIVISGDVDRKVQRIQ